MKRRVPLERRAAAYAATFFGNATREDAEIVLVDLAAYTRFYQPLAPNVSSQVLHYMEGRRSVFAWLLSHVGDQQILGRLQIMALEEMAAEQAAQPSTEVSLNVD